MSWCASATPDALIDLRRGKPFIAGDLDRTLLLDLSKAEAVVPIIDDVTRFALRPLLGRSSTGSDSPEGSRRLRSRHARRTGRVGASWGARVLVLAALVGGYWYERPSSSPAPGMPRTRLRRHPPRRPVPGPRPTLPPNPLVPYLRSRVTDDRAASSSRASSVCWRSRPRQSRATAASRRREARPRSDPGGRHRNPFERGGAPPPGAAVSACCAGHRLGSPRPRGGRREAGHPGDRRHTAGAVAERYARGFTAQTPTLIRWPRA